MARQYHVALEEGEIAPIVLLPGDPGRIEVAIH
jgi:uridine phosphorylase